MAINQSIVDQYVEHRLWLVQYENRVVRDVLAAMRRGEDQAIGGIISAYEEVLLKGAVNEWDGTGVKFRMKALERVRASLADVFPDAERSLRAALEGLSEDAQDEFVAALTENLPRPVVNEMALSRVPERHVAQMLDDKFGQRLRGSAAKVVEGLATIEASVMTAVDTVLVDAMRDGSGMRELQRAARKVLGVEKNSKLGREVSDYARTMVQTAANDVAGMIARENADVVRAEQYVATLDDDTCPICGPLDGRVFKIVDGKSTIPRPPRHRRCRCITVPVVKDWAAMGLPDTVSKDVKRILDGKPATRTKWSDWVQANPDRLERVLGPSRARLVESGAVKLKDLATTRDVLNLKELAAKRRAA